MIDGVHIQGLQQIVDGRGRVMHMMRSDNPLFVQFGECYFSEILPGQVKAWKRHSKSTQHLAVPVGAILLVIHDDRPDSVTKGQTVQLEIGRENYVLVRIPHGLWYGFKCVSPGPALIANCTDWPHDAAESEARGRLDLEMTAPW
jgi:dTDP-4-dehydrorhamnose 3,5-epimerase